MREGLEETGAAERGSLPSLLLGGLALPLLWHWASAGSSEPEQPEPLRAERCCSREKACGPSAAQAVQSARCWC